jgi:hypothetical protein
MHKSGCKFHATEAKKAELVETKPHESRCWIIYLNYYRVGEGGTSNSFSVSWHFRSNSALPPRKKESKYTNINLFNFLWVGTSIERRYRTSKTPRSFAVLCLLNWRKFVRFFAFFPSRGWRSSRINCNISFSLCSHCHFRQWNCTIK